MSGLGTAGVVRLVLRHLLAVRGAAVTVVLVVFVAASLFAVWPLWLGLLSTQDLQSSVAEVAPSSRDLVATARARPLLDPLPAGAVVGDRSDAVWGSYRDELARIRDAMPRALRDATSEARYWTQGGTTLDDEGPDGETLIVLLRMAPHLDELATAAQGRWPEPFELDAAALTDIRSRDRPAEADVEIEVMASTAVADALAWRVGDVRRANQTQLRLTGTFEPHDTSADDWAHHPDALEAAFVDDGVFRFERRGALYLHPASVRSVGLLPAMSPATPAGAVPNIFETRTWFPVNVPELRAESGADLLPALRLFLSASHDVMPEPSTMPDAVFELASPIATLSFRSFVTDAVDAAMARQSSTAALIALVASGPAGAAAAALGLAARLMIDRRRVVLSLAMARGMSPGQATGLLALEGFLLGVPAALGALVVAPAVMGPAAPSATALALGVPMVVGIVPMVVLPLAARPGGLRTQRQDLGTRTRVRLRRMAELLVMVAATLASVLVAQRGLTTSAVDAGVDPLMAATPLLLALAGAVVAMRVYPYLLGRRAIAARRKSGLTGFLGPVRAIRAPAGGLTPAAALIVGLAIAVFSSVLIATTRAGADIAAWMSVGADIRASGPPLSDADLEAASAVPGVEAIAAVHQLGTTLFETGDDRIRPRLLAVDVEALRTVQADEGGSDALLEALARTSDAEVPVLHSTSVRLDSEDSHLVRGRRIPITPVGSAGAIAGVTGSGAWVLVDTNALANAGVDLPDPSVVLARTTGRELDPHAVREALGGDVVLITPADALETVRGRPLARGLDRSLVVAAISAAGLAAFGVILMLVIGTPARSRLLAQLRTLGMSRREERRLVAWEAAPMSLAAAVAGVLIGLGMPWLVAGAVDLRPLTGGSRAPQLVIDPVLVLAVLAAFAVVVWVTAAATMLTIRRLQPAVVLRMGDDT